MAKLTTEQKQMEKEYKRLLSIIESARKGQNWIRPNAEGYTERQMADYAKYQGFIDRANERIAELKRLTNSL